MSCVLNLESLVFIGLGQIEPSKTQATRSIRIPYVGMTRAKERLLIRAPWKNEFTEKLESMTGVVYAVA